MDQMTFQVFLGEWPQGRLIAQFTEPELAQEMIEYSDGRLCLEIRPQSHEGPLYDWHLTTLEMYAVIYFRCGEKF